MSDKADIQRIFGGYVFGFMFHDIEREIWLAKKTEHDGFHGQQGPYPGGGNVLAALGLLAYTEFLGSFITGNRYGMRANFRAFLERMGQCYVNLDDKLEKLPEKELRGIYGMFRNGMAHEFAVKRDCDVLMLVGSETCGVGERNGRYFFVVERYFRDFASAARDLYEGLMVKPVLPK